MCALRFRLLFLAIAAPYFVHGAATANAQEPTPSASSSVAPTSTASEDAKVEVIDLTDPDMQRDRQRFAPGIVLGGGWLDNKGAGAGGGLASIEATIDIGMGPGGARIPWSVEVFGGIGFDPTLSQTNEVPNRFTTFGARAVLRLPSLPWTWFAAGIGLAWTNTVVATNAQWTTVVHSTGSPITPSSGNCGPRCSWDYGPGALVELEAGIFEWTTRRTRIGFGVRIPVQISQWPGVGVFGLVYAQIGVDK